MPTPYAHVAGNRSEGIGNHTEMLTDGLGLLYRSGKVTGIAEDVDQQGGFIRLRWVAGPYATANATRTCTAPGGLYKSAAPDYAKRQSVSINNTTQIDLAGPGGFRSDGHATSRHGRATAIRGAGAYASKGASRSSCLSSTYEREVSAAAASCFTLTPGTCDHAALGR